MSAPFRHLLSQGPAMGAIGRTVLRGVLTSPAASLETPTQHLEQVVSPPSPVLVQDFLSWAGDEGSAPVKTLPPHLFPQWALPLAARTLDGIPYDLRRVLNGGCRVEIVAPLPLDEPLHLTGWLESIDDNGRRAVLRQRLITGTESVPEALRCTGYAIVPLAKSKGGAKKERPLVPEGAECIATHRLSGTAGRDFAILTGDINPIHWLGPAARMAGFPNTILHGYGTLALAMQALAASVEGGLMAVDWVDVRFTKPLVLPAQIGVFADASGGLFVGTVPGQPAFMTGSYALKERANEARGA